MNALWILALLILISGVFSLAEMELASSRRVRLTQLAEAGNSGAATALAIKEHPSRLLAASQTGITAAALLMGIYGESALSASIEAVIGAGLPMLANWQASIAFMLTIVIVTAVSIILGEIVPKRIALANPEKVAAFCAPAMSFLIRLSSPAISFLSFVADRVLKLLPVQAAPAVTSMEDILAYVDEGERAGSIAPEESKLFGNVMRLEDWRFATVMALASDVAWRTSCRRVSITYACCRKRRIPSCLSARAICSR